MVDTVGLELATKSIFMQCLNDPEILEIIKGKLNCLDKSQNVRVEQTQKQEEHKIYNNECGISENVVKKIDLLLDKQQSIEEYIRCNSNKYDEDLADKLEQEKKKHVIEIEDFKKGLETEIEKYKELLEKFQEMNLLLQEENRNLLSANKSMKESVEKIKSRYSICEEMLEIWDCVNSLNQDNRDYIERLCGGVEILSILSLGRDENKIKQLWSYLRDLAVKCEAEREITVMNRYFEFCIKVCNSTKLDSEKYVISDVEIGCGFDVNQSIRTSNSRQVGSVKVVIVKGVFIGSNIKFKSIVKVE